MALTSDWHIHSRNSCDGASLVMAELVQATARAKLRRRLESGTASLRRAST